MVIVQSNINPYLYAKLRETPEGVKITVWKSKLRGERQISTWNYTRVLVSEMNDDRPFHIVRDLVYGALNT